jgi:hypothetical protein
MQPEMLNAPVILPEEPKNPEIETAINAEITQRLAEFYKHLVSNGCIKPLPTDGPQC